MYGFLKKCTDFKKNVRIGLKKCTDCTDFKKKIVRIARIFFENCTDCTDFF